MLRSAFPGEMTDSAAEGQSADASRGNDSARRSKSERMRGMIDIAPNASAADGDGASRGIDARVFDRREIDHQTVIANSQTACVVSAAADRDKQIVFAREIYAADDVCDIRAARDQPRLFVDHRVVDLAGFIVICVTRLDESCL